VNIETASEHSPLHAMGGRYCPVGVDDGSSTGMHEEKFQRQLKEGVNITIRKCVNH
jgi:hypothetical protein